MKKTEQLGQREQASITIGDRKADFVFEPDEYTGKKNQLVIAGDDIDPKKSSRIVVEKQNPGVMFASATWHFSTEKPSTESSSDILGVTRRYFKRLKSGREVELVPLSAKTRLQPGDEVEVHISLRAKQSLDYVHLRDPRPAGFEPVNNLSNHKWDQSIYWYEEIRDSGTNFFFEHLPQGDYTFKYRISAAVSGTFKAAPAFVQPMYAPEFSAYSKGDSIEIANGL